MNKIQIIKERILKLYSELSTVAPEINLEEAFYVGFKEKDPLMRVRELVFYVETLVDEGLLHFESAYYESSDKMDFNYMNSAVSIKMENLSLTELGRSYCANLTMSLDHKWTKRLKAFTKALFSFQVSQIVLIALLCVISFMCGFLLK